MPGCPREAPHNGSSDRVTGLGIDPGVYSMIYKIFQLIQLHMAEREGLEPPLRLDGILGDLHDLPLHIKQPPPPIALKDLNLAPIQQEKFGRQFELDSMLGAFFTQSWLDGSSPGDDFVSIALPQRPACLILSPTAKWRHCSRKAVKSLFVQAGKNSSKTRRGKSE